MADRKVEQSRKNRKGIPPRTAPRRVPGEDPQTLDFRRKNWVLFGSGILGIILGFGLLAAGDITLAPILLVGSYLVLIPWALVARPRSGHDKNEIPHSH